MNLPAYDFYRCAGCQGLRTAIQVAKTLYTKGQYCPCGSRRASPTWPKWYEWVRPSMLAMWLAPDRPEGNES